MEGPIRWSRFRNRLADAALIAAILLAGYGAAGLVGGAIPANAGWRPPAEGIRIYIESNGVHTDLVLPVAAAGVDWRDLVRPGDIADPRYAAFPYLAFGWGERRFYLETPRWADVRPGTVLAAAIGSDRTLVHVEHLPEPRPAIDVRPITLRPDEYRRLAAYVRASFAPAPPGYRPAPIPGYGAWDAFYPGRGHYDAFWTCNSWTGAALRTAGVRVGRWTPFPVTVMAWF